MNLYNEWQKWWMAFVINSVRWTSWAGRYAGLPESKWLQMETPGSFRHYLASGQWVCLMLCLLSLSLIDKEQSAAHPSTGHKTHDWASVTATFWCSGFANKLCSNSISSPHYSPVIANRRLRKWACLLPASSTPMPFSLPYPGRQQQPTTEWTKRTKKKSYNIAAIKWWSRGDWWRFNHVWWVLIYL